MMELFCKNFTNFDYLIVCCFVLLFVNYLFPMWIDCSFSIIYYNPSFFNILKPHPRYGRVRSLGEIYKDFLIFC